MQVMDGINERYGRGAVPEKLFLTCHSSFRYYKNKRDRGPLFFATNMPPLCGLKTIDVIV